MSSTGRKKKGQKVTRRKDDFYATPSWCVERLLEQEEIYSLLKNASCILEPCAGNGAIIKAVNSKIPNSFWYVAELRAEEKDNLEEALIGHPAVLSCPSNYLGGNKEDPEDWVNPSVIITNPPFTLWEEFLDSCLFECNHVIFLLRLGVLGSQDRFNLWQTRKPDLYIMEDRPSFTDDGNTDSDYYAWFFFHPSEAGRYKVIPGRPGNKREQNEQDNP